jgi:hypothetical protein
LGKPPPRWPAKFRYSVRWRLRRFIATGVAPPRCEPSISSGCSRALGPALAGPRYIWYLATRNPRSISGSRRPRGPCRRFLRSIPADLRSKRE